MKASLFSLLAAAALFTTTTSMAAPFPGDRYNDRNSKDFNYGFDKNHRVTPKERDRWEAAHRDDRKDDRRDYNRFDDRNSKDFNYGFDKKHRVTRQERERWEATHRFDHR